MALAMSEPRCVDIEQILEMFMLTRGVKDVVMVYGEVIAKSPIAPMLIGYEVPNDAEIVLPDSVYDRLNDLTKLVESPCDQEQSEACKDAVSRMEMMYRVVAYFEAKDNLMTAALIILADFVAASLILESAWYMRNWGHYCLRGISMALKQDDYLKWLDWPKAQSHDNMNWSGLH
ncbi:hypothetical protein PRZ48_015095 [Zasmidium cellare]|uniref:Uncharacterized protein n=1 Tax=Zasmidium cellare TaxID=395010 RepID=A0ABR0DXQ3_ZASCE|nr:hypothetical protein PRZ48_015095 [Zasmidium cellare]